MSSPEASLPTGAPRRPARPAADGDSATSPMPPASRTPPAPEPPAPERADGEPDRLAAHPGPASADGESPGGEQPPSAPAARTRRARLVLSRVDPWSVMKVSFVLSIALGIVFVTAVAVLWLVLEGMGVFTSLDRTAGELTQGENGGGLDIGAALGLGRVLTVTTVLALVNAVLLTALSTLGSFLYNLASSLVGGLQVTLSEEA